MCVCVCVFLHSLGHFLCTYTFIFVFNKVQLHFSPPLYFSFPKIDKRKKKLFSLFFVLLDGKTVFTSFTQQFLPSFVGLVDNRSVPMLKFYYKSISVILIVSHRKKVNRHYTHTDTGLSTRRSTAHFRFKNKWIKRYWQPIKNDIQYHFEWLNEPCFDGPLTLFQCGCCCCWFNWFSL